MCKCIIALRAKNWNNVYTVKVRCVTAAPADEEYIGAIGKGIGINVCQAARETYKSKVRATCKGLGTNRDDI